MKRIDTLKMVTYYKPVVSDITECLIPIAQGINEIMDYLEKNLPAKNGKFYRCLECGHTTGYPKDNCCDNPGYVELA